MDFDKFSAALVGKWQGNNQLYLNPPPAPPVSSSSALSISPVAGGNFLQLDYNWTFEGEEQTGVLLLGYSSEDDTATVAWADSFHMSARIMFCTGTAATDEAVKLHGTYSAPPGPEWGWRIEIQSVSEKELKIVMYNVSPEGSEDLAVQIDCARRS